jgi:transketolase
LEDIAIVRALPNMVVVVPCDYLETKKATIALGKYVGPAYLRFTREKSPVFTSPETPFEIGKANILRDGTDVAVIGCGPLLYNAMLAAIELEKQGINVMVVNNHTVKPIDSETIIEAAKKCGAVVTLEEHQVSAGAGSAICEVLAKNYPVPVEMIGMPDSFGESGEPDQLIKKYGMDKEAVIKAIQKVMQRKESNAKQA